MYSKIYWNKSCQQLLLYMYSRSCCKFTVEVAVHVQQVSCCTPTAKSTGTRVASNFCCRCTVLTSNSVGLDTLCQVRPHCRHVGYYVAVYKEATFAPFSVCPTSSLLIQLHPLLLFESIVWHSLRKSPVCIYEADIHTLMKPLCTLELHWILWMFNYTMI